MRNQKILKNTLFLYIRQIAIVALNLYAVRVLLNTLGIDDYGVFTVVAGFVMLLTFLPGTLASATQRFFSYALGQQDQEKLNKTFSVNWMLYALTAVVIVTCLETIGFWYLTEHIKLPVERKDAAITLYHFTVASFALSVFSAPFIAILIAHEDMQFYAVISIVEAILKLCAAVLLSYLPWDKLALYGQLLLAVSILNVILFMSVCLKKYAECQFKYLYWDYILVKEILGFTGWTMFGQVSTVFRNQAVTVLLNQFFNPATVAARAISMTVANQVTVFAQNFNMGLYPSIIKTYASDQKKEMFSLINNGSKLTFFLMWLFALPLMIKMEYLLALWLKAPPPEAVVFTQLAVVEALIMSISLPIGTAARAPGKMKLYELSLGSIQVLIFFASWLVLKAGYPAEFVFYVAIIANVLMFKVRLLLVNRLIGLPIRPFYKQVVLPITLVMVISAIPSILLGRQLTEGFIATIFLFLCSMILSITSMYYLGLDRLWRKKTKDMLFTKLNKMRGLK